MNRTENGPAPLPTGTGPNLAATKPLSHRQSTDPTRHGGRPSRPDWWAAHLIAAAGDQDIPLYGSPEWHALPGNSRLRVASAVRAAEAWRTYWLPEEHARRAHAEIDEARMAEFDDAWQRLAEWVKGAGRPRHSQLCDRRGEPGKVQRARAIESALGLDPLPEEAA